ncbi:hypothetical protein ABZU86_21315 [Streptomyces sp. NPDC005271]
MTDGRCPVPHALPPHRLDPGGADQHAVKEAATRRLSFGRGAH